MLQKYPLNNNDKHKTIPLFPPFPSPHKYCYFQSFPREKEAGVQMCQGLVGRWALKQQKNI